MYQLLADAVVLCHFAFIVFVFGGGFLVLRWPRLAWIHLPAVVWGALVETMGWICPLTPLEQWLRVEGGGLGYGSDFIERYVLPVLYPAGLTHNVQLVLGIVVVVINAAVYGWVWRLSFSRPGPPGGPP